MPPLFPSREASSPLARLGQLQARVMPRSPHGAKVQRLIETDHAGRVLYATPEAAQLFGASRHDIVGRDLFGLFGADGPALRNGLESVILRRRIAPMPAMLSEKKVSVPVFVAAESIDGRSVRWRIVKRQDA